MKQPNIILINCDDLGYGDLGCYGSKVNKTPHLDRLAAEGTRFTDFYMASPVCSPSRCAMMTGCYPPRIGCGNFNGAYVLFPGDPLGLNPEEKTLARYLKDLGYATALVGKWHCGDQPEFLPTRHGFDHYYGIPYSNDMGMMKCHKKRCVPLPLMHDETVIQEQPDQTALTERYVEESLHFIRDHADEPFFLYLAHLHVHLPLLVSERFLQNSDNGPYGGAVECIDWAMGSIMAELKKQGLDDNTLIIFTSDNGARGDNGGSNHPLRGRKGGCYEGGMRLPCIMRWPGHIPAGRVNASLITALDFLPTLVNIAGGSVSGDKPIDGMDCTALVEGQSETGPRDTFFYYLSNNLVAVRQGPWKLLVAPPVFKYMAGGDSDKPYRELYNLEADISESENVYDEQPDVVARLEALLEACRQSLGDAFTGVEGKDCRPVGCVQTPKTLTTYDPNHPYMIAMYDGEIG